MHIINPSRIPYQEITYFWHTVHAAPVYVSELRATVQYWSSLFVFVFKKS